MAGGHGEMGFAHLAVEVARQTVEIGAAKSYERQRRRREHRCNRPDMDQRPAPTGRADQPANAPHGMKGRDDGFTYVSFHQHAMGIHGHIHHAIAQAEGGKAQCQKRQVGR